MRTKAPSSRDLSKTPSLPIVLESMVVALATIHSPVVK